MNSTNTIFEYCSNVQQALAQYELVNVEQGSPNPVLEIYCHACFRCHSNTPISNDKPFQALEKSDNDCQMSWERDTYMHASRFQGPGLAM